jgi:hypothetical protein
MLSALSQTGRYDAHGVLRFHELPEPSGQEVAAVARWAHARLVRVLERHGRCLEGMNEVADDAMAQEQPVLASCYGASAGDVQLQGAAPGQKTDKLVHPVRLVPSPTEALAEVSGVNIHAKVVIDGRDRRRLERLCGDVARPPLSQERLELQGDGRVRYRFKAAWKDGTHAVLLDPLDFIARLCALIPPPRFHMLRYHGVLAAHAQARAEVVPRRGTPNPPEQLALFPSSDALPPEPPPPSRHPWAGLLKRVFAVDVTVCPRCHATLRIVELATERNHIARVLRKQALGARAPPPPRHASTEKLQLAFDESAAV